MSGLDKVFLPPPHEIRGATPVDQVWIDETIGAGQASLGWQIKPRPQNLDANRLDAPPRAPAVKPKPKKVPLWKRLAT